jgi:hypothetical protein
VVEQLQSVCAAGILVETTAAAGDCTCSRRRQKEFVEWIRQDAVRGHVSRIDSFWLKQYMTPLFLRFLLRNPSLGPKTGDAGEIRSVQNPQTPFLYAGLPDMSAVRVWDHDVDAWHASLVMEALHMCHLLACTHYISCSGALPYCRSLVCCMAASQLQETVCAALLFKSHQPHACICLHYIMQHKKCVACGGTHLQVGSRLLYS